VPVLFYARLDRERQGRSAARTCLPCPDPLDFTADRTALLWPKNSGRPSLRITAG